MRRKNFTFSIRGSGIFTALRALPKLAVLPVLFLSSGPSAHADGSDPDGLGAPSIAIAQGTGIVARGTGLVSQPGTIELTVPAGATVKQVLLYWNGFGQAWESDNNSINIGGYLLSGTKLGGPDLFYDTAHSTTYRADITNLNLVGPGTNVLEVSGLQFNRSNNGAGILAIIDDGSGATDIALVDGNDLAYFQFAGSLQTTVPQTFTFAAADTDRIGSITMFFASVASPASNGDMYRPATIQIDVGNTTRYIDNQLGSHDGDQWDTLVVDDVLIPAGATSLTIHARSENRLGIDQDNDGFMDRPASFVWTASGLFVPPAADQPATLGDRVWEDLNADGTQNCVDGGANDASYPADGIIGNAGDSGAECNTGVDGVVVRLLEPVNGSCENASNVLATDTTSGGGFYGFDVSPGDYCVSFVTPSGFDCTDPNKVDTSDVIDSDGIDMGDGTCLAGRPDNPFDPLDNPYEVITLAAGENDLTWDLGLVRISAPLDPRLGDRVWEDLNGDGMQKDMTGDGMQNCVDGGANDPGYPADGIIGNAGDAGPECGTGVDGVTVRLYQSLDNDCGNGDESLIAVTTTTGGGYYDFTGVDGLAVATPYCVGFDLSTVDPAFCSALLPDGTMANLGSPLFTTRNQGEDDGDSDADVLTGLSESVTVSADNLTDLNVDAGIVCPGRIGDRVWMDEDEDGLQKEGFFDDGVEGATVELWDCGIDGKIGGTDDVFTGETRTTDANGYYAFDAEPGNYFLVFTDPLGRDFTTPNVNSHNEIYDVFDSDCMVDNGQTSCFTVGGSRHVDMSRDCGIVPDTVTTQPLCELDLVTSCRVETPPAPAFEGSCKGKLQEFTLIWNGSETITVGGVPNTSDGGEIHPGDEVTFFGPFDNNDVFVNVFGSALDESVFHMSCSDDDFDGPEDCGKAAGDAKYDSGYNTSWLLEGFLDAENRVLDCTAPAASDDGYSLGACEFEAPVAPSCETTGKPDNLTWRYDGGAGSCADSSFVVQDDFVCTGSVDSAAQVLVADDDGGSHVVNPGDEFTITRNASEKMTLSNGGGTQDLQFHMSCSEPIEAGLTAGALTLVALDGQTGGVDVTYRYHVTNMMDPLNGVMVTDDVMGEIGGPMDLGTGFGAVFDRTVEIFETTSHIATASGTMASGNACSTSETVTVSSMIPPCSIGFKLDKVADDALKIKVTNNDSRNRDVLLESLYVAFPAEREYLREIKLDGAIYKKDDSDAPILSNPAMIGENDWTNNDASNRVLEPGETRTLEIKTTRKSSKDGLFEVNLSFGPACNYSLRVENQQLTVLQ